jgi:hypothetical protein
MVKHGKLIELYEALNDLFEWNYDGIKELRLVHVQWTVLYAYHFSFLLSADFHDLLDPAEKVYIAISSEVSVTSFEQSFLFSCISRINSLFFSLIYAASDIGGLFGFYMFQIFSILPVN